MDTPKRRYVRLRHGLLHAGGLTGYPAGAVVPVVPARNQPDFEARGLVFIDTPELRDDHVGLLANPADYEELEPLLAALYDHLPLTQENDHG